MAKNILDYLERSVRSYPSKPAFVDRECALTFAELVEESRRAASSLLREVRPRTPVIVCMDKCAREIEAFLAVVYAGAFYVPLDIKMPYQRMKHIVDTLEARVLITKKGDAIAEELKETCAVYYIEDMVSCPADEEELASRRRAAIDTDPLYSIFTSGSTGIPKGIVTCHRAIINFIDELGERFGFSHEETLANQIPFYFDASTKDIYLTLKYGCTTHIIPQAFFLTPKKLASFLNEHRVTSIVWVPSLLCMLANYKILEKEPPQYLKKVFFVGEVMPTKQLNAWRECLPDVTYVNLYGSSEVTGNNTYYVIQRPLENTETIPIGIPFDNVDVFLLDENDRLVEGEDAVGEICVRGSSLTHGYYRNPEKTREVFVQNPLQSDYPETVYRTGDLGRYNALGELLYVSRKDHQIKRMGHRIELGEIEAVLSPLTGVDRVCCVFDAPTQRLLVAYEGEAEPKTLESAAAAALPSYMIPSEFRRMDRLALNANGKIDRLRIKDLMINKGE